MDQAINALWVVVFLLVVVGGAGIFWLLVEKIFRS